MSRYFLPLLLTCTFCSLCRPFKILAFLPFPTVSHHNAFLPLLNELSRRGHDVTYYTPVRPAVADSNLRVRLIPPFKNLFTGKMDLIDLGRIPIPSISHKMSSISEEFSDIFYGNEIAQEIIRSSESYDAVIMESYFLQEPVSALIHKFGCVGIEVSSLGDSAWISELSGLPLNPAFQLDFKSRLSDEMTLFERLYNSYVTAATLAVSYFHLYRMQAIMDKYFRYPGWESRPSLQNLLANRSMILVNTDPVLSYPYPTASHVKNIAGMNLLPNDQLPPDLQEFMDDSKDGVIYFSLGSNLNTSEILDSRIGSSSMDIFKDLPQRVLIKWEEPRANNSPPNVKVGKWFPQKDILAHKNCVLFVTHGGFLSLMESVFYGVPVVGLPFFGDQPKNMIQAQKAGYGLMIKDDNISMTSLTWVFQEVLQNPKYRKEAQRRSQMLRDRQYPALEEAVHWVEYAIKYPNALTPKSAFMTFWEKRIFDVGILLVLTMATTYIAVSLLCCGIGRKNKIILPKIKVS